MKRKHPIIAAALAGVMALSAASLTIAPATTAEAAEEAYSDHTSNEYSHRLHEEDVTHRMNISSIRYEYRKDGDKKKFDRAMKKEQHRHPFLPAQPCAGFHLGNCEPLRLPRLRLLAESPAFCYTRSCIYRKKAPASP